MPERLDKLMMARGLAESRERAQLLIQHGLVQVRFHPMTFGIATLYIGTKPGSGRPHPPDPPLRRGEGGAKTETPQGDDGQSSQALSPPLRAGEGAGGEVRLAPSPTF